MSSRSLTRRWLYLAAAGAMAAATLSNAAPANADPGLVSNYANYAAEPICSTLDDYPTLPGMAGVVTGIEHDSGFTVVESIQVVAIAVNSTCSRHTALLNRFLYTVAGPSAGGRAA